MTTEYYVTASLLSSKNLEGAFYGLLVAGVYGYIQYIAYCNTL